jgi:hypothetical protein
MSCSNDEKMRKEILKKNDQTRAYYATNDTVKKFTTDFDSFPYERYFRGQYDESKPVIIDRYAGYRKVELCLPPTVERYSPFVGGYPDEKRQSEKITYKTIGISGDFVEPENDYLVYETACSTVLPMRKNNVDYKGQKIENNRLDVVISP